MQIALDAQPERQSNARQFLEREAAEFGTAEAEVREPEQGVAIGVQFGREPRRGPARIEEFDDRNRIALQPVAMLAIRQQGLAQRLGQQ